MILEDPLEGVKLCQGHTVYHLTLWLGHWAVSDKNMMRFDVEQHRMYYFFLYSAWLHLATAILQIMQTRLKIMGKLNYAAACQLMVYPVCFYPILYSSYNLGFIIQDIQEASAGASGVEVWFILETFLFVSQVFGGIAFMVVSEIYKLHSIGN